MKTLTRTIIVLVALSMLSATFAQAQTGQPVTPSPTPSPAPRPVPAPTPPTPPTLPSSGSVELAVANDLLRSVTLGSRSSAVGTVLVIPSEQTRTEDLLAINEDMSVMSRIFEKNLEQDRIATARSGLFAHRHDSFSMLLGGGSTGTQSMYLQGFGALFMMKVDFPLSPPPDVQEEEKEIPKTEQGDPVWREMRQQMYEPEKVMRNRRTDRPENKYDAEKVENLKTTLIKALKHAANIRSLQPDESVILTITGSGEDTGTTITPQKLFRGVPVVSERDADGTMKTRIVQGTSLENIELASPTIVVIRAKKSDIDEFAKGDLDIEQFRQRVQLLSYPLLSTAGGSRNPYGTYYRTRSTGSSSTNRRR